MFIILANIRTPYCCIENDFRKYNEDYKYTTEIFEKQNDLNYICISYDINNNISVDYGLLYNISTTTFDDFFDNILVADRLRIEKLINKCRLKQIIFKKGNSNYNGYVQYVIWMNKSYAKSKSTTMYYSKLYSISYLDTK